MNKYKYVYLHIHYFQSQLTRSQDPHRALTDISGGVSRRSANVIFIQAYLYTFVIYIYMYNDVVLPFI